MFQERMPEGHHLFAINIGNGTNSTEFKSPSTNNAATEPPASNGLAISSLLELAVS